MKRKKKNIFIFSILLKHNFGNNVYQFGFCFVYETFFPTDSIHSMQYMESMRVSYLHNVYRRLEPKREKKYHFRMDESVVEIKYVFVILFVLTLHRTKSMYGDTFMHFVISVESTNIFWICALEYTWRLSIIIIPNTHIHTFIATNEMF